MLAKRKKELACASKRYFIESDYPDYWATKIREKKFVEPYLNCFFELLKFDKENLVLEVGVGEGRFISKVIKEGAVYVGIDISRRILNYATEKVESDDAIHLVVADAESLPFRDKVFDECFCISTIFFIPNQSKAIKEMGRIVKTNLVIDFRNTLSPALMRHRLETFLRQLRHALHELKLRAMYTFLRFPCLRKLGIIKYGEKRVYRAVTYLDQYYKKDVKNTKRKPYSSMLPCSIKRAFKSANLQILSVSGFDLPEYSDKSIPHYSIFKWLKPALIIKAIPVKASNL